MQRDRPSSAARGYDYRWRKVRLRYLREQPLCERCLKRGMVAEAVDVHHKVRIADDRSRRLDRTNLEALCPPCHRSGAQSEERLGYSTEIGLDGWPMDERHPARRQA